MQIREFLAPRSSRRNFTGNVLVLTAGTVFGQALGVGIMPILTRLYSPEDFGSAALYASLLMGITVIVCLRYEFAIVLPEKDEDAANLLAASVFFSLVVSCLSLILVISARRYVIKILDAPALEKWLWFLPISLLLTGLFQAFVYWSTRRNRFPRLAMCQVIQSVATPAGQIGAGTISGVGSGGLISGTILGLSAASGSLIFLTLKEEMSLLSNISIRQIRRQLLIHWRFPLISSWSGLINTGAAVFPVLLLGHYFSAAVVGFFALGHRLLTLPMSIIGTSIARVFFAKAVEARREETLNKLSAAMYFRLLYFALTPIGLIMLVAPELFVLCFGEKWIEAGIYAQWMGPWLIFQFAVSPISSLLNVLGRQSVELVISTFLLIGRIAAIMAGGMLNEPLWTMKLFGAVGSVSYFFYGILVMGLAGVGLKTILMRTMMAVVKALPFMIPPLFCKYFFISSGIVISVSVLSGVAFLWLSLRKISPSSL